MPSKEKDRVKITQSFGITDLLEFLDADGDRQHGGGFGSSWIA